MESIAPLPCYRCPKCVETTRWSASRTSHTLTSLQPLGSSPQQWESRRLRLQEQSQVLDAQQLWSRCMPVADQPGPAQQQRKPRSSSLSFHSLHVCHRYRFSAGDGDIVATDTRCMLLQHGSGMYACAGCRRYNRQGRKV